MSDDPTIRAALEAAGTAVFLELERQEMTGDHDEKRADEWVAAAAIAAFNLRMAELLCSQNPVTAQQFCDLAAAVEEAGR